MLIHAIRGILRIPFHAVNIHGIISLLSSIITLAYAIVAVLLAVLTAKVPLRSPQGVPLRPVLPGIVSYTFAPIDALLGILAYIVALAADVTVLLAVLANIIALILTHIAVLLAVLP